MHTVIETRNLTRRYGQEMAVDSLDMQVRAGEVYGFLGLNGAGKTTTIRMIMGLIRSTEGSITLFGREVPEHRMSVMGRVGSLVESPSYYAHLTARENLRVPATLLGVETRRIDEVLEIVGLGAVGNKRAGKFSLGMKQRLGIAAALLHEPELLVLDEPTNGLDPAGIHEIRNLIVRMPKEFGVTVLVSSHLLSEIDQMASHVGVIHNGRMRFQGPIGELRQHSAGRVHVRVDRPDAGFRALARAGLDVALDGDVLVLDSLAEHDAATAVRELVSSDVSVHRVEEHRPTLEDVFLSLTGDGDVPVSSDHREGEFAA